MPPRLRRVPSAVVELLRLCVVVFFAGVGYYVADAVDDSGDQVLGRLQRGRPRHRARLRPRLRPRRRPRPGHPSAVGQAEVGPACPVGRADRRRGDRCRCRRDRRRRRHLAGAAARPAAADVPDLRCSCWSSLGALGYRLGASKREAVLGMFGSRVGMADPPVAAAALPRVLDTSVAIDGRIVDVVRVRLRARHDARPDRGPRRAAGSGRRRRRHPPGQGPPRARGPRDAAPARPASRSRCSTTRCPGCPRSTPSWCASAWTEGPRCSPSTRTWPGSRRWPAYG